MVGDLVGVGNEFDLGSIEVKEDYKISLRFNNFETAY